MLILLQMKRRLKAAVYKIRYQVCLYIVAMVIVYKLLS